jgi:hypothetical protein
MPAVATVAAANGVCMQRRQARAPSKARGSRASAMVRAQAQAKRQPRARATGAAASLVEVDLS